MSALGLARLQPAVQPDYWREFDDIREKDAAVVTRVRASDGYNLTVYEFGKGNPESVMVVNPLVSPFLLLAGLAGALAERYHVISWENRGWAVLARVDRGYRDLARPPGQDLIEISQAFDLEAFHAITYCSGAPIVARAASQAESADPIHLALCAERGGRRRQALRQYQDVFAPDDPPGGHRRDTGGAAHRPGDAGLCPRPPRPDDGLGSEISRLTYLNMRDLDAITGFARVMADYWAGDMNERLAQFDEMCRRHPVMVMHSLDDPVVHYSASVKACTRSGSAKLVLYPTGGHFKLCERGSEAMRDVMGFMASHEADVSPAWPTLRPGLYLGPLWAVDWT